MNGPSLNEIIIQIQNWQVEVHSDRNDGWTRAHYMQMLNKIRSVLEPEPYKIYDIPHDPGLIQDDKTGF